MNDMPITFSCFAVAGSEDGIKEEIENTQKMLGRNYIVSYEVCNGTAILAIKKKVKRSLK